jgi:hypothetical protein
MAYLNTSKNGTSASDKSYNLIEAQEPQKWRMVFVLGQ